MDLPPFLLDHWLAAHDFSDPPIRYNLASSTGPRWPAGQIAALGDTPPLDMDAAILSYAPPEGSLALRAAVADFHGVDPDWVVMTTGSSEALSILSCLAARPGAHILIPDPASPAYAAVAQAWGMATRSYRLDRDNGFAQDAEAILAAVDTDTAAVIVNTPHNPTGSVMLPADMAALAAALMDRGVLLIVDEVYHPLYFGEPLPSAAAIPGVIVTSDLSKAMSLPGLRTGWLIDANAARRKSAIDARSYFTVSGSPLLEALAARALENRSIIFERLDGVGQANMIMLDHLIGRSGGMLDWVRPRGGTTCFPWFADGRDSRPFCQLLSERGVLLAPGDCFDHPAHMRIGLTQQDEGFAEAVEIIASLL